MFTLQALSTLSISFSNFCLDSFKQLLNNNSPDCLTRKNQYKDLLVVFYHLFINSNVFWGPWKAGGAVENILVFVYKN